jgi:hypothetical protein
MAPQTRAAPREQVRIFVSYSHLDRAWLGKFQVVLAPLLRDQGDLLLWDDSRIPPGEQWQAEVSRELQAASVAVLLVSQRFLASRFIAENELPPLLRRAEAEGIRILWIPIGACLYQESPLVDFQAAWDPARPLNTLKRPQQEHALVQIAQAIKDAANSPTAHRVSVQPGLMQALIERSPGQVPLMADWYAIPWPEVLGNAERIECALPRVDTWIEDEAGALEDLFARGGSIRVFLPMPGSHAAHRVGEHIPAHGAAAVDAKMKGARSKLRALRRGRGQLDVRWTSVANGHGLILLDDSVLILTPCAHFGGSRAQNPAFVVPLERFPTMASWAHRELAGFLAASSTRIKPVSRRPVHPDPYAS